MTSNLSICTIISKNYISFARTLTDSFLKIHPNGKVFVLLVDDVNDKFDPTKEKFTLVSLGDIGIKDLESFCFKYSVLEQNTGAKAQFLKYLLEKYNLEQIFYFDPDILIINSLENLSKLLKTKSIILTPHILKPIHDNRHPSEFDIIRSGSFNLGFIGLSNSDVSKKFLDWWNHHLMESGYSDVEKGLFTDQKWIDIVPSIFDDVYIIRHPGYNVAYWNLMQRDIRLAENKVTADEKPLYFFHFSGFVPENLEIISKHQNRLNFNDIPNSKSLFELYRDLLIENNYLETKKWKCKFDYFDNGVKIPIQARRIYSEAIKRGKNFENPFKTSNEKSFFNYLNQNIDHQEPLLTRLWYKIYNERDDLIDTFPDILQTDRYNFLKWIDSSVQREYSINSCFLPSNLIKNFDNKNISVPLSLKSNHSISEHNKYSKEIGVNVLGYLTGQFGVAESSRRYVSALQNVHIPLVLNNILSPVHSNNDTTFDKFEKNNPYSINIIVVNADQTKVIYNKLGKKYFEKKYNIGIWAWELPEFPEKWLKHLDFFDEIWTLSNFVAESIAKFSPIPVVKIPCPIKLDESTLVPNKNKFGLKDNSFAFLFIFDFYSVFERKNPMGVVKSFKKAFSQEDNVILIIKCINGQDFQSEFNKLKEVCNQKNIKILDRNMEKEELSSLIASCDCYVSLHRSEGFGLTIAESMYARKPVIATGYSGNMEFMNSNNSYLVKYDLVQIEKNLGPYTKGSLWAEPDLDHASSLMRIVFDNPDEAKNIGIIGSKFIKTYFSSEYVGKLILKRFNSIFK